MTEDFCSGAAIVSIVNQPVLNRHSFTQFLDWLLRVHHFHHHGFALAFVGSCSGTEILEARLADSIFRTHQAIIPEIKWISQVLLTVDIEISENLAKITAFRYLQTPSDSHVYAIR